MDKQNPSFEKIDDRNFYKTVVSSTPINVDSIRITRKKLQAQIDELDGILTTAESIGVDVSEDLVKESELLEIQATRNIVV